MITIDCLARVQSRGRVPSTLDVYVPLAKGEHLEMYTGKQNLKSIESNQGYSRDTVSAWSARARESG
jgi:hypothetical protein